MHPGNSGSSALSQSWIRNDTWTTSSVFPLSWYPSCKGLFLYLITPCHFNKVNLLPHTILLFNPMIDWFASLFLDRCNFYLHSLSKLTSLSQITFAGYVWRDSSWFTICYILFEQVETEVRVKVSFGLLYVIYFFSLEFGLLNAQILSFHTFVCLQLLYANVWVSQMRFGSIRVMLAVAVYFIAFHKVNWFCEPRIIEVRFFDCSKWFLFVTVYVVFG